MKKTVILSLAFTLSMATLAYAGGGVDSKLTPVESIVISKEIPNMTVTNPETKEEVTLVMARPYAESLGYNLTWDSEKRETTFVKGGNTFKATIGSNKYYSQPYGSEAKLVELETEAIIVDGRTYVPASFAQLLFDVPVVEPMPYPNPTNENKEEELTETSPVVTMEDIKELDSSLIDDEVAEAIAGNILMKLAMYEDEDANISYDITLSDNDVVRLTIYKDETEGAPKQIENISFNVKTGEEVITKIELKD